METYLALFDERGQVQRVAIATSARDLVTFVEAGFVEITEDEYNEYVSQVEQAGLGDLALLAAAAGALASIIARRQSAGQPPATPNRGQLDRLQQQVVSRTQQATRDYYAERITLTQWQRRMADAVNQGNLAARQIAVGGVDNLTAADRAAIERANETQLRYIRRFRRDLEGGGLSEAQAVARSAQYGRSSTPVFEAGHARALGLPLLPAQPGVRTSCRSNCKCRWDKQQLDGAGNWDCYWRLAPAEHCEECLARRRAFNPLRIRGGVIQPYNPIGIYR